VLKREDVNFRNVYDIVNLSSKLNESQLLVYLSTAALYEGYDTISANESFDILIDKLDIYAQSIYERDMSLKRSKCRVIGLRIGMTCGISRRQRYDLAFMKMILTSVKEGVIYTDKNSPTRSILGLHDLYRSINAIICAETSYIGHRIYNICSFNIRINELAEYISSELKSDMRITDTYGRTGSVGFSMNTDSFCNDFNFVFKETKESILADFIKGKDMFMRFTNRCRICKSDTLSLILDLGNQPLANNLLLLKDDLSELFPLNIYRCNNCFHTQLGCTVPPLRMFDTYTYVSGVSSSAVKHFKFIADYLISKSEHKRNVLELASNDGSQLDFFKLAGFNTFGVDPAKNICEIAIQKGHTIISDYWGNTDLSDKLPSSFDIIIAQNVLAHVPDPVKFIKECVKYMRPSTILYVQTSQSEMYLNNEFDTIYHEHMSFFTLKSFKFLSETCELYISDMQKFPIHGVSYGLCFKKRENNEDHCSNFYAGLQNETEKMMYAPSFYYKYRLGVVKFKHDMLKILGEYKESYTIVGYGAAAKGITMLNYIGFRQVDYIVDDCVLKSGKFVPGLKIPIVKSDVLQADTRPLLIIILPWNIKDELIEKIRKLLLEKNFHILIPFPSISIC
jgi:SAM-dependent methyltransferase